MTSGFAGLFALYRCGVIASVEYFRAIVESSKVLLPPSVNLFEVRFAAPSLLLKWSCLYYHHKSLLYAVWSIISKCCMVSCMVNHK